MEETSFYLKERISALLNQQKLAALATQGTDYPYNTLVAYAYTEDLKWVLFATKKDTTKYRNIKNHSRVSILIDNRSNDPIDFTDAVALTILGKTKITKEQEFLNIYLNRFPYLKEFIQNPQTALIQLEVEKYIYVQRFQEVFNLKLN